MKATWNGATLAESDDTVVVEGNHYFPEASLKREYTSFSNHKSMCAWKGKASYLSLIVKGEMNESTKSAEAIRRDIRGLKSKYVTTRLIDIFQEGHTPSHPKMPRVQTVSYDARDAYIRMQARFSCRLPGKQRPYS